MENTFIHSALNKHNLIKFPQIICLRLFLNNLDQWLDQPINVPIDEGALILDARVYPVKGNTVQLLNEFKQVYDAVEFTHLTPPETPPQTPPQTPLQSYLIDSAQVRTLKGFTTSVKSIWSDQPAHLNLTLNIFITFFVYFNHDFKINLGFHYFAESIPATPDQQPVAIQSTNGTMQIGR